MNEQQMAQLLAYLQQQMESSQQNMADLPQRAMQAGATPTQGSGGTILSPDPVQRVRQANEAWRERFPLPVEAAGRVGMTPEGFLANQGNTATNQLAQLGFMAGIDPQKVIEANQARKQYSDFAKAQREGTNGVTSQIPASEYAPGVNYRVGQAGSGSVAADGTRTITSPYGTASMRPQGGAPVAQAAPQPPAAPATAGAPAIPVGDIFSGVGNAIATAVQNAPQAWRDYALPGVPANPSTAAPIQGSGLRQDVLQGLNFIPNVLLGAAGTVGEGLSSLFGSPRDIPDVNLQSDFFSNLKNSLRGVLSPTTALGRWANETAPANPALNPQPSPQANPPAVPGMAPENRQQQGTAAQPAAVNFFNQTPGFNQGQTTPLTQDQTRNMFMTEEEKRRRSQTQPMMAGR
jgi:hypothetical protein